MPSTVVLRSFLFLPAFSEDLEKESCGRNVEPVKGVSESSRCDMSPGPCIPNVCSPVPAAAHTSSTAQGASAAKKGGDTARPSVPSPSSIPEPVAASDSARAALSSKGPQIPALACGHASSEPQSPRDIPATLPNPRHPLGPWPHSPAPFRWIISERMERASSEALSVMQEAARLRKDTLSSSDNAQDCGDTQWAPMDPRLQGRRSPVPSRPLLCRELTPQPRQKLRRGPKAESATPAARVLPPGAGPGAAPGTPHSPADPREQASQVQQGGGVSTALSPHQREASTSSTLSQKHPRAGAGYGVAVQGEIWHTLGSQPQNGHGLLRPPHRSKASPRDQDKTQPCESPPQALTACF